MCLGIAKFIWSQVNYSHPNRESWESNGILEPLIKLNFICIKIFHIYKRHTVYVISILLYSKLQKVNHTSVTYVCDSWFIFVRICCFGLHVDSWFLGLFIVYFHYCFVYLLVGFCFVSFDSEDVVDRICSQQFHNIDGNKVILSWWAISVMYKPATKLVCFGWMKWSLMKEMINGFLDSQARWHSEKV